MTSQTAVYNLLSHYPEREGAKILQLLIQHPDTDIYASVVELSLFSSLSPLQAQGFRYHLAPIRMTDEATLRAVDKRLNQLIFVEASSRKMDADTSSRSLKPQDEASTQEIAALIAYRKECTLPTGKIKCFGDDDTKAFRRQAEAIRRLLKRAEKDGHHEAVAIVKAQLKKGRIMRWETT